MKQVRAGSVFTGKWTRQPFKIAKQIGEGANGAVYLIYSQHGYGALKCCQQASDAALEWNILEKVSKVQSSFPRPILIDDWEEPGETTYFYVMEWVSGEPLDQVLQSLTPSLYYQVVEKIVLGLASLHESGMAFCDIKPQNILVSLPNSMQGTQQRLQGNAQRALSVRFVDVGGVTVFGRSVRQFTPMSDRAFWDLGTRRAEPSYDLCGLSLSLLLATTGGVQSNLYQMTPAERQKHLKKVVRNYPYPPFAKVLQRILTGEIADAECFLKEWHAVNFAPGAAGKQQAARNWPPKQVWNRASKQASKPQQKKRKSAVTPSTVGNTHQNGNHSDWTEWVMWISLTAAAVSTCAAWATFLGWTP